MLLLPFSEFLFLKLVYKLSVRTVLFKINFSVRPQERPLKVTVELRVCFMCVYVCEKEREREREKRRGEREREVCVCV